MFKLFKKNKTNSLLRAARSGNGEKVSLLLNGNLDVNSSDPTGLTALHLAAKQGHVSIVKDLLKRGADVGAKTKKLNTPLHLACLAGKLEVVKVLLQNGAQINATAEDGFTALYMASQEGHVEVVEELLSKQADATFKTNSGSTALSVAVDQRHAKVAKLLLEQGWTNRHQFSALHVTARNSDMGLSELLLATKGVVDVNKKSWSGFTALHMCSHYGNVNLAQLLIQHSANVNIKAKNDITALHVASKQGHLPLVKLLLDNGADLHAKTLDGLTALHCAAKNRRSIVLKELLDRGASVEASSKHGMQALHCASQADSVDCCAMLLQRNADVDAGTIDGLTPLHIAAHLGHVKTGRLLLQRGCRVDARTITGFTPLHVAIRRGKWKVVELLLRHAADITACTHSGMSALHLSSLSACPNITSYLLQGGEAALEARTGRGETALHIAACCGHLETTQTLLSHGAQVDAKAHDLKHTPLHLAAEKGHHEVVKTLLRSGANPNSQTTTLLTPLHLAIAKKQPTCVLYLLEHGANPLLADKNGNTAFHSAVKYNNVEALKCLFQRNYNNDTTPDSTEKSEKANCDGMQPLHLAAHLNHLDCLNVLLDHGYNPNIATKNGYTALHIAAYEGRSNVASCLINKQADLNYRSMGKVTPAHLACMAANSQLLHLLLEKGADATAVSFSGMTMLHYAALSNEKELVAMLMKAGVAVNSREQNGNTPLTLACYHGNETVVEALLGSGADVNAKNKWSVASLHYTAQRQDLQSANHLLNNGAETNIFDSTGWSPLCLSQRNKHHQLTRLLLPLTSDKYLCSPGQGVNGGGTEQEMELLPGPYDSCCTDLNTLPVELREMEFKRAPVTASKDKSSNSSLDAVDEDEVTYLRNGKLPAIVRERLEEPNFVAPLCSTPRPHSSYSTRANSPSFNNFLVSFMVDARGGIMHGQRQHGVCIKVPPAAVCAPVRLTCRYITPESVHQPPRLREDEALACRLVEMGPVAQKFSKPVSIRIPHYASLKQRRLQVLCSDDSLTWRPHLTASNPFRTPPNPLTFFGDDTFDEDDDDARTVVIEALQLPRYFALVSTPCGTEAKLTPQVGGILTSEQDERIQVVVPKGAVKKEILVQLQSLSVTDEQAEETFGGSCSPVVSIAPRCRKFHTPVTVKMPLPARKPQENKGELQDRLLCSLAGEYAVSKWEDITDSTSIKTVHDCVVFLTTASARYWMVRADKKRIKELPQLASKLHQHACAAPFFAHVVVLGKMVSSACAMRVYCVTEDRLERVRNGNREMGYEELGSCANVEVYENRPMCLSVEGGLQLANNCLSTTSVPLSIQPTFNLLSQTTLIFHCLRENRMPIKVAFKSAKTSEFVLFRSPLLPANTTREIICIITLRGMQHHKDLSTIEDDISRPEEHISKAELRLTDIADALDVDWIPLALQLGLTLSDVSSIQTDYAYPPEQALVMLHTWVERNKQQATGNVLERALKVIGREDVLSKCMYNIRQVTDHSEMAVAKEYLDAAYNSQDYLGRSSRGGHSTASSVFRAPSSDRSYVLDRSSYRDDSGSEAVSLLGRDDFLDKRGNLGFIDASSIRTCSEVDVHPTQDVCDVFKEIDTEAEKRWKDDKWTAGKNEPINRKSLDIETKIESSPVTSGISFPEASHVNFNNSQTVFDVPGKMMKTLENEKTEKEIKEKIVSEETGDDVDRETTPVIIYLDDEQFRRTVNKETKEEIIDEFEDENGMLLNCKGIKRYKTETVEVVKPVLEKKMIGGKMVESKKEVVVAEEITEEITEMPEGMDDQDELESIVSVTQTEDVLPNGMRLSKKLIKTKLVKRPVSTKGADMFPWSSSLFSPSKHAAPEKAASHVNEEMIVASERQKSRSTPPPPNKDQEVQQAGKRVILSQLNKNLTQNYSNQERSEEQITLQEREIAVDEKEAKEDGNVVLYRTRTSHVVRPVMRKIMRDDSVVECVTEDEVVEKRIEQEVVQLPEGMTSQEASLNKEMMQDLLSVEEFEEMEGDVLVRRVLKRISVKQPVVEDSLQCEKVDRKALKQLPIPSQCSEALLVESKAEELCSSIVALQPQLTEEFANEQQTLHKDLKLTEMTRSLIEKDTAQSSMVQKSVFATAKTYHLPVETEILGVQEWDEIVDDGKKMLFRVVTKKKSKPVAILDKDKNGVEIERIICKDKLGIEIDEEITELEAGVSMNGQQAPLDTTTTFENFEGKSADGTWIRKKVKRTEIKKPSKKEKRSEKSIKNSQLFHHSFEQLQDVEHTTTDLEKIHVGKPFSQPLRAPNTVLLQQQQQFQQKQQQQGLFPKITEGTRQAYNHPIYGQVMLTTYVEEPGVDEREEEGTDGSMLKYKIITKMHKEKVSVMKEDDSELVLETNNLGTEIEEYIEEIEKGLEDGMDEEGIEKITSVEESTDEMGEWGWLKRKVVHVKIYRKTDENTVTVPSEEISDVVTEPFSVANKTFVPPISNSVSEISTLSLTDFKVDNFTSSEEMNIDEEFQNEMSRDDKVCTMPHDIKEKIETIDGESSNKETVNKNSLNPMMEKIIDERLTTEKAQESGDLEEMKKPKKSEELDFQHKNLHKSEQTEKSKIEKYYELLPDNTWVRKKVTQQTPLHSSANSVDITDEAKIKNDSDLSLPDFSANNSQSEQDIGVGNDALLKPDKKYLTQISTEADDIFESEEESLKLLEFEKRLKDLIPVEEPVETDLVEVRGKNIKKLDLNSEIHDEFVKSEKKMQKDLEEQIRQQKLEKQKVRAHNIMVSNLTMGKQIQNFNDAFNAQSSVEEEQEIIKDGKKSKEEKVVEEPLENSQTKETSHAVSRTNASSVLFPQTTETSTIVEEPLIQPTAREACAGMIPLKKVEPSATETVPKEEERAVEETASQLVATAFDSAFKEVEDFSTENENKKNIILEKSVSEEKQIVPTSTVQTEIKTALVETSDNLEKIASDLVKKAIETALKDLEIKQETEKNKNIINDIMLEAKVEETLKEAPSEQDHRSQVETQMAEDKNIYSQEHTKEGVETSMSFSDPQRKIQSTEITQTLGDTLEGPPILPNLMQNIGSEKSIATITIKEGSTETEKECIETAMERDSTEMVNDSSEMVKDSPETKTTLIEAEKKVTTEKNEFHAEHEKVECREEEEETTVMSPCGKKSINRKIFTKKYFYVGGQEPKYLGKYVEENIFESSFAIKDPYAADVETKTSIEEYEEKDEEGAWVKKVVTTVSAYLNDEFVNSLDLEPQMLSENYQSCIGVVKDDNINLESEGLFEHGKLKIENVKERVVRKYPAKRTLASGKKVDVGKQSESKTPEKEQSQQTNSLPPSREDHQSPQQTQEQTKQQQTSESKQQQTSESNEQTISETKQLKVGKPPSFIIQEKQEKMPNLMSQTTSQNSKFLCSRVKRVVTRKVRKVLHNGEVVEDVVSEELPDFENNVNTVTEDFNPTSVGSTNIRASLVSNYASGMRRESETSFGSMKVYTDTMEGEPERHTDVKETEQVLSDGRVMVHKTIKTKEKQTIVKRVVLEGDEGQEEIDENDCDESIESSLKKYVEAIHGSTSLPGMNGSYLDTLMKQPEKSMTVSPPKEDCKIQNRPRFRVSMERGELDINDLR